MTTLEIELALYGMIADYAENHGVEATEHGSDLLYDYFEGMIAKQIDEWVSDNEEDTEDAFKQ